MPDAFPPTRISVLERLRDPDAEVRRAAGDELARGYWQPVHAYARLRWRLEPDDAADLAQAFFAEAFDKGWFADYDPGRARFRTFVRTCVDRFAAKQHRAARAQKRGGGAATASLDAPGVAEPAGADPEQLFRTEMVRALFEGALADTRAQLVAAGKPGHFALLERYDLGHEEGLGYADLAREAGLPVTTVTNHLAAARRVLRAAVLERLRALCGTEAEFRIEARDLLGIDP